MSWSRCSRSTTVSWRRLSPRTRVLHFPSNRIFTSFGFQGAMARLMEATDAESWGIAFTDAVLEPGFVDGFGAALKSLLSVQSVSFKCTDGTMCPCYTYTHAMLCCLTPLLAAPPPERPPNQDNELSSLVGDLPPWVNWLTFDNVLSPGGILSVALLVRQSWRAFTRASAVMQATATPQLALGSGPSTLGGDSGERVMAMAGVTGLAIRNHSSLRLDELKQVVRILVPRSPPAGPVGLHRARTYGHGRGHATGGAASGDDVALGGLVPSPGAAGVTSSGAEGGMLGFTRSHEGGSLGPEQLMRSTTMPSDMPSRGEGGVSPAAPGTPGAHVPSVQDLRVNTMLQRLLCCDTTVG